MRFHLVTLGCPKNSVDSEMMAELLRQAGHLPVDSPSEADLFIVNTCGFIRPARDESYRALRELAAQKRAGQWLVAAGCLVQYQGEVIRRRVPAVDAIIGTRSWPRIATLVESLEREGSGGKGPRLVERDGDLVASVGRRATMGATAYLKIADGCDAACAFCAIPLIKGPQRSKPLADVLREARELADQGVQEIVLIAQDTTAYGRDRSEPEALPGLLRALAKAVPGVSWLRILYAYPQHVTPQLIETMASLPQVCHYLDLPLQHGHPEMLKRMRRPQDIDRVHHLIARLRQAMPDIALRSSFIVGHPGETEDEFASLLSFIREISFDQVGVFSYSPEEGTPAASLPDRVPPTLVAERHQRAMLVQQEISRQRNQAQVGRVLRILVEGAGDGLTVGRSYREAPEIDGLVLLPGEAPVGEFIEARIVAAKAYDLIAEPLEPGESINAWPKSPRSSECADRA